MRVVRRFTATEISDIRSRRLEGQTITQIAKAFGRRKETIWYQVKDIEVPASVAAEAEDRARKHWIAVRSQGTAAIREKWKASREGRLSTASPLWRTFGSRYVNLPTTAKGKIAETAVLMRLMLLGAEVFHPVCEYGPCDLLVKLHGKTQRLQVRVTGWHSGPGSAEKISACNRQGKTKLTEHDCDFVVGYSLIEDACYVVPVGEIGATMKATNPKYKERWDLMM